MLDRLSEKLTAEAAALPVVSDGDRNFARLGIVCAQHVPDDADRARLVQRQGHVCHVSVPVGLRHLVEQSLAEPWYRREETQVARPWRQIHDRSLVDRAIGRAQGSYAHDVVAVQRQLARVDRRGHCSHRR